MQGGGSTNFIFMGVGIFLNQGAPNLLTPEPGSAPCVPPIGPQMRKSVASAILAHFGVCLPGSLLSHSLRKRFNWRLMRTGVRRKNCRMKEKILENDAFIFCAKLWYAPVQKRSDSWVTLILCRLGRCERVPRCMGREVQRR